MSLPLPRPPAAILFDFDGVIVDSARLKTEAYGKIYAAEDSAKVSRAMRHQQMHGGITRRATLALFEREFFGRAATLDSVEKLAQRYGDIVFDCGCGVFVHRRRANAAQSRVGTCRYVSDLGHAA